MGGKLLSLHDQPVSPFLTHNLHRNDALLLRDIIQDTEIP
jgi:hypothetical protein